MNILKKIVFILSPHERKRAVLLMLMLLVMAILDMIGVASIMPFITVLTNPDIIENNFLLKFTYEYSSIVGVNNVDEFVILLGILVFFVLVTSLIFKALTNYIQLRFALMREYSIGKRLMQGYLSQPYSWFLNRHSADFGKTILSEVYLVVSQALVPMISLIANFLVVLAILILLVIIDPVIAVFISFTFGLTYFLIFRIVKNYLRTIGTERLKVNQLRFTSVSEAFGAAKEVKLGGLEYVYIGRFAETSKIYAKHQATAQVLSTIPRFIVEAIGFGGIILVILYFLSKTSNFTSALPIIAVYAFAGYRVLPSLQKIYNSISQLRFVGPALDNLYKELKFNLPNETYKNVDPLPLEKVISLKNIVFNYPNTKQASLKNINLEIAAGTKVGLVGSTGSGKTTTADIILGLLEPQEGRLEVDGKVINDKNRKEWQKSIGYVPQHIYLSDDTVTGNIALGVNSDDVNYQSIERAAKAANLHEFIINELPSGYKTKIGERGIRLSGGQRQRLGIARALYHNPKVLVLDEATSAMDNFTEKLIMDSINKLSVDKTIIIIAHRLTTIKNCEVIFLLEKGELKNQGAFDELIVKSDLFRKNASEM